MFQPKLFTTLKHYSKERFFSDLIAGVIVGIVAIPLAIAFGIASGVSPEKGLITAIVAGFLVSALGGSRVQIGGPTGAFIVIIYGIVQKYGLDGLILATFLAGFILLVMGFAKFGMVVKFIPHSVIVGFTSGIAVVIFSSEIKDFLGLKIGTIPVEFLDKWKLFLANIGSANIYALWIALSTVLIIAVWPKVSRKIPGALIAVVVTSVLVQVFHWPVETIGSRFGDLPHTLLPSHFPAIDLKLTQALIQPAFTIAFLCAIESLLSAVVSDGMIGGKHRSNMELVAQGAANMGSAVLGGIPATGAIARTVTNIKNGGRTPVAGIIHSLTILIIMLFLGVWINFVPLACLAGILVVVSYHMSEWRSFRDLLKGSRGGIAVLLATFFLTVLVDLTVAIETGMVLSAFLFLKRMADATNIHMIANELKEDEKEGEDPLDVTPLPDGVEIYEINGPFFFGVAHKFEEATRIVAKKPKVRILRLRNVPIIDSTGLQALKSFYERCKSDHIVLIIAGVHTQPLNEMMKSNLYDLVGEDHVVANIKEARLRAETLLAR